MEGNFYNDTCPVCGNETTVYVETNPFETAAIECATCGFYAFTKTGRHSLDYVLDTQTLYKIDDVGEELSTKETELLTKEYKKYDKVDFENMGNGIGTINEKKEWYKKRI